MNDKFSQAKGNLAFSQGLVQKFRPSMDMGVSAPMSEIPEIAESPKAKPTQPEVQPVSEPEESQGLLGRVKDATQNIFKGAKDLLGGGTTISYERPKSVFDSDAGKLMMSTILKGIAHNETEGVENAYSFRKHSGNPDLGDDLGKYQVTEGELKTYGPKYLGEVVTPEEFMSSPALQEMYMKKKVMALTEEGYEPTHIADIHRSGKKNTKGPGGTEFQSPGYVKGFLEGANE